ncbi:hypothetical protein AJ78_06958 [Emergomyces pasteurianus Ep9510]|uniref:MYND-type domain-containing protein n=1 Tax=Emergomyces pasteurianus Ep9510 TaxID=1447872 RepID=A0A1J9PX34_9EURO|nr:hypothetical protein AJ78_06958 [Emergomyces pasteurianus Ep9510]
MADANLNYNKCGACGKVEGADVNLKRYAKCQSTFYCCRDCQKKDWKTHKKICARNAASRMASSSGASPKGLQVAVEKPFHRLNAKTWIHDRPKEDVYKLLIDTYRLRMEDNYKFEGNADMDSIYGGAQDGRQGFERFLRLANSRPHLLPPWWEQKSVTECVAVGAMSGWSDLRCAIGKSDVIEHYGNSDMPMQLRMFGEQIYGYGPGGHDGAAMLRAQMMIENGKMVGI